MNHFEFYVLWTDQRWTVEGIDMPCTGKVATATEIDLARAVLIQRYEGAKNFEILGPLYHYGPKG